MSNLSEFLARELREPTPEEAREIQQRDLEERRQREADRHESEIKCAYMNQPGATEAGWSKERAAILAQDRQERTVRQRNAAQAAITRSYRSAF